MKIFSKCLPALACLLFVMSVVPRARAAENAPSTDTNGVSTQAAKAGAWQTWVVGTIISMRQTGLTIKMDEGLLRHVMLTRDTEIVVAGKMAPAHDLKVGDSVLIGYVGPAKHAVARLVQVEEPTTTSAPALSSAAKPPARGN